MRDRNLTRFFFALAGDFLQICELLANRCLKDARSRTLVDVEEPPSTGTILVVDDEPMVREVLTQYLQADGFQVVDASDGDEAVAALSDRLPDLVLLDLMLPKRNGLEVLAYIRQTSKLPVILLTARGDEADRVQGLEAGADDYVVKPFSAREVVARVRSVLRRTAATPAAEAPMVLEFGDITVDPASRTVVKSGKPVDVPRREFDLLTCLLARPDEALSREDLLRLVWDSSSEWQDPSTVTVHVRRLRGRLENDPSDPQHFQTVFGVGYRFVP